jgi:hypothetical protein
MAGRIEMVYEFGAPDIVQKGEYSIISFQGTKLLGKPGKAMLPFFPVKLLLPPGEIAHSIRIEYENPYTIKGKYMLMPQQEVRPLSDNGSYEWLVDRDFYSSREIYPSLFNPHLETHFYNGFGIALSAFTPVRYLPRDKQVEYYQRVIVSIETIPDPDIEMHQRLFFGSAKKTEHLSAIIQNPEYIPRYFLGRDSYDSGYDYLIITKNQYVPEFDTLVSFYKPRGIRSKTTSTENIDANFTGVDLQEKIRNYIISEYNANGIEAVLIGGDKEIVPYRGFYCYVQSGGGYSDSGIPADLYYSALDGNWNTNGNSLWGEPDEDDLYPEVGVGRLTFSDTAELHNMIHKIIMYQEYPVEGELTRPLLSGEYLYNNPPTYGSDYINLLVGCRSDNGYYTCGIPPAHPRDSLYDSPAYTWTKGQMISRINEGRPWVHHCGHANYNTVMRLVNTDITNANFSQVNGITHNYTIIYTHGCICGGFDYTDCIGEKMIGIDNLAVAFVGNSRYGWFNEGTTDGPSEHLHREFIDALYRDSLFNIGQAHLRSKAETAPFVEIAGEFEPGATRWCFYDNNVLGDPMMALWTEEPYLIEADYPAMIPIGADSLIIQLTGQPGNCKIFTCSIYRNDTLFGAAKADSTGTCIIVLSEEITEGPIFLVVSGYNILPQYFTIEVSDYWLGLTSDWNDPGNWYTGDVPDSSTCVIIPAAPPGAYFPVKNTGSSRICKAIHIEPGAQFKLKSGEVFTVVSD